MCESSRAKRVRAGTAAIAARGWLLLLSVLLLTACPVDDRLLTADQSGGGRASDAGRAGSGAGTAGSEPESGGANDAGSPGQAGDSAAGEGGTSSYPDGCADLDQDHVSDCTETALENPAFAINTLSWTAEPDATISWDARDLLGSPSSGSARITSSIALMAAGDSLVAAEQCIPVHPGTVLAVFANARIEAGQVSGRAAVSLWFFASEDCPGTAFSEAYETPELFESGKLLTLQGSKLVPEQMHSVRVRLGVIKPNSAASFAVHFDNILVREE